MESVFLLRHQAINGTEISLGFFSTLAAVEAQIEVAKWQPAYRGSPNGFAIDTYVLDKSFAFQNDSSEPMMLIIEPWASSETISPGSRVVILYPSPSDRQDTSYADREGDTLVFWCSGPTCEVEINGKRIAT